MGLVCPILCTFSVSSSTLSGRAIRARKPGRWREAVGLHRTWRTSWNLPVGPHAKNWGDIGAAAEVTPWRGQGSASSDDSLWSADGRQVVWMIFRAVTELGFGVDSSISNITAWCRCVCFWLGQHVISRQHKNFKDRSTKNSSFNYHPVGSTEIAIAMPLSYANFDPDSERAKENRKATWFWQQFRR